MNYMCLITKIDLTNLPFSILTNLANLQLSSDLVGDPLNLATPLPPAQAGAWKLIMPSLDNGEKKKGQEPKPWLKCQRAD